MLNVYIPFGELARNTSYQYVACLICITIKLTLLRKWSWGTEVEGDGFCFLSYILSTWTFQASMWLFSTQLSGFSICILSLHLLRQSSWSVDADQYLSINFVVKIHLSWAIRLTACSLKLLSQFDIPMTPKHMPRKLISLVVDQNLAPWWI